MTPRSLFTATAIAVLLSTTTLSAQTENTQINDAIAELQGAGYDHIEVQIRNNSYKIEASGSAGSVERVYDQDGNLMREEVTADGIQTETVFDADGNVVSMETGDAVRDEIDDGDDDHGEDDHGDNHDDHGDDDHGDDDHDDDHDDDGDDDDDSDDD